MLPAWPLAPPESTGSNRAVPVSGRPLDGRLAAAPLLVSTRMQFAKPNAAPAIGARPVRARRYSAGLRDGRPSARHTLRTREHRQCETAILAALAKADRWLGRYRSSLAPFVAAQVFHF